MEFKIEGWVNGVLYKCVTYVDKPDVAVFVGHVLESTVDV